MLSFCMWGSKFELETSGNGFLCVRNHSFLNFGISKNLKNGCHTTKIWFRCFNTSTIKCWACRLLNRILQTFFWSLTEPVFIKSTVRICRNSQICVLQKRICWRTVTSTLWWVRNLLLSQRIYSASYSAGCAHFILFCRGYALRLIYSSRRGFALRVTKWVS